MFRANKTMVRKNPGWFLLAQTLFLLQIINDLAAPLLLQQLINSLFQPDTSSQIIKFSILMVLVSILAFIFGSSARIVVTKMVLTFGLQMRNQLYHKIHSFTFPDMNVYHSGSLIRRLGNNLSNMVQYLGFFNQVFIRSILMFTGGIIASILILYNGSNVTNLETITDRRWIIIVIVVAFVILSLILIAGNNMITKKYFEKVQPYSDNLNNLIQEIFLGIRFIKSYNLEKVKFHQATNTTSAIRKGFMKVNTYEMLFGPMITLVMNVLILLVIWIGSYFNLLNLAQIISVSQTLTYVVFSVILASFVLSNLGRANVASRRVYEIFDYKNIMHFLPPTETQIPPNTTIEFHDVDFSYYTNSRKVLEKINLRINPGETLGVIGKTGSGKTSFINMIARLYDVSSGSITIGGVDVKKMDPILLRNWIAFVPQKNNLFSGTIASNLQFAANDATTEDMWNALEQSCATSFVQAKENQLEAVVEQRGTNFSGGQKQRLCIARALLKKAKILILDDSTSALDAKTEKQLIENLHSITGVSKILVSQKISSIIHADRILVLDQGRIVGLASHKQLLQTCQIYQEIFESQNGVN